MLHQKDLYILIVEDNEADKVLLKEYLDELSICNHITQKSTLGEAIAIAQNIKFDLIFLDLTLPDTIDAKDCVEKMVEVTQDAPIIVLTGYNNKEFAIESLHKGIEDYLLKDEITVPLLAKSIGYSIERNHYKQELKKLHKQREQDISDAVIQALDQRRHQLSIELHDNVIQLLVGVRMFMLRANMNETPSKEFLSEALEMLVKAIDEVRDLSHSLAPPDFVDKKLEEVLNGLIDTTKRGTGIAIKTIWSSEIINSFSHTTSLNIFRIVQEQLNNIIKYAQATKVEVELARFGENYVLRISDNGKGFNTKLKSQGLGITNIKTRAIAMDGNLEVISKPSKGCALFISFTP